MSDDRADRLSAREDRTPRGPGAPDPRPEPDDLPGYPGPFEPPSPAPRRDDYEELPRQMPPSAPGVHSDKPWTRA